MPSVVDIHIGSRVRRTRELRGVTQRQLANAIGATVDQMQRLEAGIIRTSALELMEIGQALDVNPSFFFAGLGELQNQSVVFDWDDDQDENVDELLELIINFFKNRKILVKSGRLVSPH